MKAVIALAGVCLLLTTGCGDKKAATKSNFEAAIQAHLDTEPGLCVSPPAKSLPFTLEAKPMFEFSRPGEGLLDRANALVGAGLLARRDVEVAASLGPKKAGYEYSATEAGAKLLVKGASSNLNGGDAFCAGKYKVAEISNFTEPSDALGMKVSQVNYRYTVNGAPDWAKAPVLQKAYPQVAKDLSADAGARVALILMNDGWIHERTWKKRQ